MYPHERHCPAWVPEVHRHLPWYKRGQCNCGWRKTLVYEDDDCKVYYAPAQPWDRGYSVSWKKDSMLDIKLAAIDCRYSVLKDLSSQIRLALKSPISGTRTT